MTGKPYNNILPMTDSPRPYQLLIFDWDGTLMDSVSRIVHCLRQCSIDVLGEENRSDHELKDVIGLGLREAIQQLHPAQNEKAIDAMVEAYRQAYLYSDLAHSELFSGVSDMLDALENRGYWLAVATGKGREGLDQVLKQTGMESRFHTTRCASETFSKPHPLMLEEILQQLGLEAKDALMIGDTIYDLQMAHNAGMDSLAVSYGVHPAERLAQHNPLKCLHNIDELSHYLRNL